MTAEVSEKGKNEIVNLCESEVGREDNGERRSWGGEDGEGGEEEGAKGGGGGG